MQHRVFVSVFRREKVILTSSYHLIYLISRIAHSRSVRSVCHSRASRWIRCIRRFPWGIRRFLVQLLHPSQDKWLFPLSLYWLYWLIGCNFQPISRRLVRLLLIHIITTFLQLRSITHGTHIALGHRTKRNLQQQLYHILVPKRHSPVQSRSAVTIMLDQPLNRE